MLRRYVVARDMPGAGNLSADQLRKISHTFCTVSRDMWPGIEWVQSYVTPDRLYCVYLAENEPMVREHAARGGVPSTEVAEAVHVIDPVTATPQRLHQKKTDD